jgi:hypothetical protein
MSEVISGWRRIMIAAAGTGSPPTGFTELGRLLPNDPEFEVERVYDCQGYPIYQMMFLRHDIWIPKVSAKTTIDTYDGITADVAFERIDGTYLLYDTVRISSLGIAVRDNFQCARMFISQGKFDILDVLGTMTASTGSDVSTPAGSSVRPGRVARVHWEDPSLTHYDFDAIIDVNIVDDTPELQIDSGEIRHLGKRMSFQFTILDRGVFDYFNDLQLTLANLPELEFQFTDDSVHTLADVGFIAYPVIPAEIGSMVGCRLEVMGYSDSLADYLTFSPSL